MVFPQSSEKRYCVVGAYGFFGAWIVRRLLEKGVPTDSILLCDKVQNNHILQQVLRAEDLTQLRRAEVDVTNLAALEELFKQFKPTYIIHLAGLQIPTCRANPVLGASVNVVGTVVIFQAAVACGAKAVVYASSAAACGDPSDYEDGIVKDEDQHKPRTHYGVFKLANEGTARIFFQDQNIPSVGLRPHTVYGVGREIGMTSGPTKAIKAGVLGRGEYAVAFSGETVFSHVQDIADIFIRSCDEVVKEEKRGAWRCNIEGSRVSVQTFADEIQSQIRAAVSADFQIVIPATAPPLPFPSIFRQENLLQLLDNEVPSMSIGEGIRQTVEHMVALKAEGRLSDADL